MQYNTSNLQSAADCEKATKLANSRKDDIVFEQTVSGRQVTGQTKSHALTNASLISTKAEITGTEAAIAIMPDGDDKVDMVSRLRRLNDRKDNLEERIQKGGAAALLDTELDTALLSAQLTEIDVYFRGRFPHRIQTPACAGCAVN